MRNPWKRWPDIPWHQPPGRLLARCPLPPRRLPNRSQWQPSCLQFPYGRCPWSSGVRLVQRQVCPGSLLPWGTVEACRTGNRPGVVHVSTSRRRIVGGRVAKTRHRELAPQRPLVHNLQPVAVMPPPPRYRSRPVWAVQCPVVCPRVPVAYSTKMAYSDRGSGLSCTSPQSRIV